VGTKERARTWAGDGGSWRERHRAFRAEPGLWNVGWTLGAAFYAAVAGTELMMGTEAVVSGDAGWGSTAVVAFQVAAMSLLVAFCLSRTAWAGPWFDRPLRSRRQRSG
jgi:hypothetical protein